MGLWADAWKATEDNKVARIEKKSSKQAGSAPTMLVKARSRQTRDLLIRHGWWLRETTSAGVAPIVQYMMENWNPHYVPSIPFGPGDQYFVEYKDGDPKSSITRVNAAGQREILRGKFNE